MISQGRTRLPFGVGFSEEHGRKTDGCGTFGLQRPTDALCGWKLGDFGMHVIHFTWWRVSHDADDIGCCFY